MLRYTPGDTALHGLDPRTKLAAQASFVAAAFAHTTLTGLLALTVVAVGVLVAAGLRPGAALGEVRGVVPFLLAGPVIEAARLGSPWFVPADAAGPALASYRTVLLLLLAVAYVRTTPVRDSEAAVGWLVPGRPGRLAALGVGLVFRFLPLLQADISRTRTAMRARLGTERSVRERVALVATAGLGRALGRADRLSLALRARCVSWNPTTPRLRFDRADLVGLTFSAVLLAWGLAPWVTRVVG